MVKYSHSKRTHFCCITEFQERFSFLPGSSKQHSEVAERIDLGFYLLDFGVSAQLSQHPLIEPQYVLTSQRLRGLLVSEVKQKSPTTIF